MYIYLIISAIILYLLCKYLKNNTSKGGEINKLPKIYYINLKHRKDRKDNLLKQLKMINYPNDKIVRIDAIKKENGAIGCGLSHIKALKTALKNHKINDYIAILEDDFEWKKSNAYDVIINAINSDTDWNVILLACNGSVNEYNKHLLKINNCQTASGYIIKIKYIPELLKIWEKDMNSLLNDSKINKGFESRAIDQSWKKLQKDKWYTTNPIIGKQMASYSDIEKKQVDYGV